MSFIRPVDAFENKKRRDTFLAKTFWKLQFGTYVELKLQFLICSLICSLVTYFSISVFCPECIDVWNPRHQKKKIWNIQSSWSSAACWTSVRNCHQMVARFQQVKITSLISWSFSHQDSTKTIVSIFFLPQSTLYCWGERDSSIRVYKFAFLIIFCRSIRYALQIETTAWVYCLFLHGWSLKCKSVNIFTCRYPGQRKIQCGTDSSVHQDF